MSFEQRTRSSDVSRLQSLLAGRMTCSLLMVILLASVAQLDAQDDQPSLADELPRIAPTEPGKALDTFKVQQGFTLQLVAAEPDVSDPVDACFDERGRMFVAEMHGYPFSQEPTRLNPKGGGKPDAGIIRMLEDTNGDGRMDVSVKFADGMRWPTSVCCWNGGVFVLAPPNVWYFKDTDGDNVADVREVVFEGIGRDNVQGVANNLKWGPDNRIYAAGGRNPSTLKRDGKDLLKLGGKDFSFDPRTYEVRAETGGRQFGHSFDDFGNRFVCTNSDHIQHIVYSWEALSRNSSTSTGSSIRSIAAEGAAAPVFRRSQAEPWRIVRTRRRVADPKFARLPATERVPIGFFTSATGITVYRGGAWPDEYRGQIFIGDVGGNLVHRKRLEPKGISFVATRTDKDAEFIASTDNWFRPVNFVNAPDGTLYLLDMYRETIEHPYSIPDDMKKYLHLESGDDRGRIYRILGPLGNRRLVKPLADRSTADLVTQLESPNVWTRETAQRLLFERRDRSAVELLQKVARTSEFPLARIHSLSLLAGLEGLAAQDIAAAAQSSDPHVRAHAAHLAGGLLPDDKAVAATLNDMTDDTDTRVLFQVALALGHASAETASTGLVKLLQRDRLHSDVRGAVIISMQSCADRILKLALTDPAIVERTVQYGWLTALIASVNGQLGPDVLLDALATMSDGKLSSMQKAKVLLATDTVLRMKKGPRLRTLLAKPQAIPLRLELAVILSTATVGAMNAKLPEADRHSHINLLQLSDTESAVEILGELLSPTVSQPLQIAVVKVLDRLDAVEAAALLIERWRGFSPTVRRSAVDALTRSVANSGVLLDAIKAGQVRSAELERERKQLLLNHPNTMLRDRARMLFAAEVNADRAAVVADYQSALELEADIEAGRELFIKKCSLCHRVGTEGKQVGPDIVSVTNKAPADLLLAIMDPNREAQPNFNVYTAVTEAGRVYNGIIVAESGGSIRLRRAEGKEDTIPRAEIAQLVSSGKSLMPEGLEKDLSKQQIANVIAFIKSLTKRK